MIPALLLGKFSIETWIIFTFSVKLKVLIDFFLSLINEPVTNVVVFYAV